MKNGITKINIGTEIRQNYEKALKDKPGDTANAQESVYRYVKDLVADYYEMGGSVERIWGRP